MWINHKEFNEKNNIIKVYNLNPYILYAVTIFISFSNALYYNKLLTPNPDGSSKIILNIDSTKYNLKRGSVGESRLNPITYRKPLNEAKFIIRHNVQGGVENITTIVGSQNSSIGTDWVTGTNIVDKDDFISIYVDSSNITEYGLEDLILDNMTLVVEPLLTNEYKEEVKYSKKNNNEYGYGESSFGGFFEFGVEPYGGITIL